MSKYIHFFATDTDLRSIFTDAERQAHLQYALAGRTDQIPPKILRTFSQIPNIGFARYASSTTCDRYLISFADLEINGERLPTAPFFDFHQILNPKTVVYNGGGLWKNEILLRGSIATASADPESLVLMKLFRKCFKKHCKVLKGNFIGPEAEKLWGQGMRLTGAEQSLPIYDLTP